MSPRTKRTLGQKLIREFVLLIGAIVVAAITMALIYQFLMAMVVPELANGMNSAPPAQGVAPHLRA